MHNLQPPSSDVLKLQQYFGDAELTSHSWGVQSKVKPRELHRRLTRKRKIRNKTVPSTYNPFSGALVSPTYGLLIEGEVTNSHWYCDHHALAKSTTDKTLGVPHCVFSNRCAEILHSSKLSLPCIDGSREVIKLVISAPEDIHHKREISVEVIQVDQTKATSESMSMKGCNNLDLDLVKAMRFFSSEDMSPEVDVTIILGRFTIYRNAHPKMLLLRFSSMQANVHYSVEMRNQIAKELYHILCPLSGQQSYELVQRGGSSGKVSIQSDQDLLDCIHDAPGLCPRQMHGVLIFLGTLTYYLVHRNVRSTNFVCYQYSPPKEGGSFKMPPDLLYRSPVLCEFTYLKMMAIEVLKSLNIFWANCGLSSVCEGVIECESRKMNGCYHIYKDSDKSWLKFLEFLAAFNTYHSYSMVCYPVGIHNDHFKDDNESLENKILMSIEFDPSYDKAMGRGGCVMGSHFVYALLDWKQAV